MVVKTPPLLDTIPWGSAPFGYYTNEYTQAFTDCKGWKKKKARSQLPAPGLKAGSSYSSRYYSASIA